MIHQKSLENLDRDREVCVSSILKWKSLSYSGASSTVVVRAEGHRELRAADKRQEVQEAKARK